MRTGIQSVPAAAFAVIVATSFHPAPAHADGPRAAYDDGGNADASLDPGEEQMTADEENKARLHDLSDAYHNGYNARAKEDAETYSSLRDQLTMASRQRAPDDVPPLPSTMPDGDDASVTSVQPVPPVEVAQRALPPAHRLPPARQYTMAPRYPRYVEDAAYAPPPAYQAPPVYQQPVIVQQTYAPPAPPVVQYVPIVAQTEYVPPPPVYQQPVMTVAAPWGGYPQGYYGGGYGYPAAYGYRGWR